MATFTIGRYEVEGELGDGGMSVVYLARDPYIHRLVAVKVLSYQFTTDDLFQEFFHREAELIAALEHPCIVPIFDFGLHGVQPYIVMRHMVGGTLQDRLDREELKLSQLSHICGSSGPGPGCCPCPWDHSPGCQAFQHPI